MALVLLAGGCTDVDDAPARTTSKRTGCGPLRPTTVAGRAPAYIEGGLDRFANDHAACAGVWLRAAGAGFVPQGVAVRGRTAWVSGFDGDAPDGHLWCTVIRLDLRTGHELDRTVLRGVTVDGEVVSCRHAGGVTIESHGLWLAEAGKLWLLDPDTLTVERRWVLADGIRGSFAVVDDRGRLGIGAFRTARRGWLDWLDPKALLAGSSAVIGRGDVREHVVLPPNTQGAYWGRLGEEEPGLWLTRSHTRCGILVGPSWRRGVVPGAEGMAPAGRNGMWVVSESGSRRYQREGGRPVVPTLVRLDVSDVHSWDRPACTV
ncbi:hypothetical protein [Nocardioides mangrovi]|uniref:Glutaminyl-peptide cyclotransferase n=1 Tax=Nocardioides mangrovi TaxID=2874580 RepID=A0ABS7UHK4_9ACTN|nr:hypothetical protein [Nocardioides mangrovi]MBZ5740514.1 hypothetical protein [Nocardioides mangrovi]